MRALSLYLSICLMVAAGACATAEEPATDTAAEEPVAEPVEDLTQVDTSFAPALTVNLAAMERRESGLFVQNTRRGTGAVADSGQWVDVHYTGWLSDGTRVDDSRERGEPHRFPIGYGRVLPAWDEGVRGMREGGRRKLVVPPALAYGRAGKPGTVPSRATMVFEIELVRVHR